MTTTATGSTSGAGPCAATPTAISAHATPCSAQPIDILTSGLGSAPRRAWRPQMAVSTGMKPTQTSGFNDCSHAAGTSAPSTVRDV